ncbi:MAG: hypothetical protein WAN35_11085 [Terracidiphilus sp.]
MFIVFIVYAGFRDSWLFVYPVSDLIPSDPGLPLASGSWYIFTMKKILAAVLLLVFFASPAFASKHNHKYPHHHRHHNHPHHV